MSDIMLHGVLRMPPELWHDDPIDIAQRHSRYLQASERILSDEKTIAELLAAINNLRHVKGRHHTEQAYNALLAIADKVVV